MHRYLMIIRSKQIHSVSRCLADKAQASQTEVEDKEWIDSNGNSVFDDSASTENAYTGCERPGD